ncbi:ATP-binding protein [Acidobacteria bacterium AH-259-A15]|nr:ATP-binding protein [Acidobacteria bacterium AH-259-A15]
MKKQVSFEGRVFKLALAAGLPGSLVALVLLWAGDHTLKAQWTFTLIIVGCWLGFVFALRRRIIFQLQILSNILGALREGDYSMRARARKKGEGLTEVVRELNALSETLREQRLGALEASALLRKVMEEIDVAVFTFDGAQRLRLVNRAGERLLGQPAERLLSRTARQIGLDACLVGEPSQTLDIHFPGGSGRWGLRRTTFREHGLPHQLLVLADLSRPLREEERQAWQRLIRVLGHELNNSLTPIKSIAGSLENLLRQEPLPEDWRQDMEQGLRVIFSRVEALNRFMGAYSRLARLPRPTLGAVDVRTWVHRVAGLETRLSLTIKDGPDLTIQADGDQLDQLLINLVRNAADATLQTGGSAAISWKRNGRYVQITVEDEGPGLSNTANLFVPFFTTKPEGTGIGLVLCRQIAEAHGGKLTLSNRHDRQGCQAQLFLPLA